MDHNEEMEGMSWDLESQELTPIIMGWNISKACSDAVGHD